MKKPATKPATSKPSAIAGGTPIQSSNTFPVVGIGASAGGLDAFKKLLKAIPENSGMAFVLVQHLDPNHESLLPEILQKVTNIPVLEITDDIKVQPDHIYVIPSNKMMVATDGVLLLAPRPVKDKTVRNLPIDLFFTSLAEVHQSHSIGVVLSGTASDGTKGLKAIKEQGGITFAQSEESAQYDGMPQSAIQAGVVDFVLPPEEIPKKLLEITKIINGNEGEVENLPMQDAEVFKQMLALLRIRKGTDFTYYKQTTIRRRIFRRMALNKNEEPSAYLNYLRENKPEQDILYQDLLIPVTSFFRDEKSFDHLCETVFPQILKNKSTTSGAVVEPIRVWVTACSTGQEVYSIAMCLKEYLTQTLSKEEGLERIQIFATDISEPAILKARTGIYLKSETDGLSPQRLQEFFTKTNGSYQVNKSIRDMCVFAVHNFLKDPPFGKMDFISCRNVLIYMEPYLQKKALTTFHYALNPKGFLLLGKSETISSVPDLFSSAVKSDKLFNRKDAPGRFMLTASHRSEQSLQQQHPRIPIEKIRTDFQKTADDIILSRYTPAGVVVNEEMDIVHFRGKTGNYLEQLPGKPSHNLLKMAKQGLAFELRNILHKAKKEKASVIKENIPVGDKGNLHTISIEAMPLPDTIEPHFLVLFHEEQPRAMSHKPLAKSPKLTAHSSQLATQSRIDQLEKELLQAREDMRSITEDQEAANEELQSANEELLSGSEELQSLNEELETGKEELQSTNEELSVVNQEMIGLNEQVTEARNYAEAIITTIREPLLVLDRNLRIKSANSAFYKTFRVNELETEGKLVYHLGDNQWNIPELRTMLEEILPKKMLFADFEVTRNFQHIGERVMLLNAREITREKIEEKLILLAIEDVTEERALALAGQIKEKKQTEERIDTEKKIAAAYKAADAYTRSVFMQAPAAICILQGPQHVYILANEMYMQFVGNRDVMGKAIREALPEFEGQGFFELLDEVYKTGKPFNGNEIPVKINKGKGLEDIFSNFTYQPTYGANGNIDGILVLAIDVTGQVNSRKKCEESEQQFRYLVEKSPHPISIYKGKEMTLEVANEPLYKIFNVGEQALGKPLLEILPEMKEQPFMGLLLDVLQNGVTHYGSEQLAYFLRENGEMQTFYFNFVYQPYHENDGSVSGVMALTTDVTEQVVARKKIEESEFRYQNMVHSSPSMICILKGEDLIIEIANDAIVATWGKGKDVIGKPLLQVLPELIEQGFGEILNKVYTTGITFQAFEMPMHVQRNGTLELSYYTCVYQAQRNINGEIEGIAAIAYEVTPQAEFNLKIKESEEQFRTLTQSLPQLIWTTDKDGLVEFFNQQWFNYTGSTPEQSHGNNWAQYIHPQNAGTALAKWQHSLKTGETLNVELQLRAKDGSYKWFYVTGNPVKDDAGKINKWIGTVTDIDERKTIGEKIKESEIQFSTLANNIQNLAWMANADGFIFWYNNRWYEYTGTTPSEMVGWGWKSVHDPEQLPFVMERWQQSINTGEPFEMTFPIKGADNKFRSFLTRVEPLRNNEGKLIRWVGTNTDITEQKETQALLEYRKALLEAHNEASVDGLLLVDTKGKIISYNTRFIEIWNMPQHIVESKDDEAALSFGMTQLVNPEHFIEKVKYLYEHPNETTIDVLEYKDGKIVERHGYPVLAPDGSYYAWSWTFRDITEARNADNAIRQSEQNFRQLADLMPEKVTTTDAQGNVIYFNQNWLDYTGLSFEELNRGWEKAIHPDDMHNNLPLWKQALATGTLMVTEQRILSNKGEYRWHLTRVSPVKDDNGKITKWISATTEIQEQKEQTEKLENAVKERTIELSGANEELQQKNQEIALSKYNKRFLTEFSEKFSAYKVHNEFFNSLVQFIADTTGMDYVFAGKLQQDEKNELFIQTIALSAFGKPVENIIYPLADGPCEQIISGEVYSYPNGCRQTFPKNKTIEQFNVEGYVAYPLNDEQGNAVGLIAVMHEKEIEDAEMVSTVLKIVAKRAEIELERIKHGEQLMQNNEMLEEKNQELEKMNIELQSFTYVSSHDLQEPLRKIKTFAKLIQDKEDENLSDKGKDYFYRIQHAALRMQTLIDDLLAYSRVSNTEREFENTNLHNIIDEVIKELADTIEEKNAVVEVDVAGEVSINRSQFSQLIQNLLSNALKFSKAGTAPHITIKSKIDKGGKFKNEKLSPEKNYCHISIADNGIGFDPQYKDRIFEVFQRLHGKDEYEGTGIGLAIVKKIIDNHNGIVTATGVLSKGTTFDIYIPA